MHYEICDIPIDVDALVEAVRADGAGALVTFVGNVRATSDGGRAVVALTYEAHAQLALGEMRAIGAEATERFSGARVAMAHRIGTLAVGEAAVAVAVSAPHRGAAFAGCAYAIDELKRRVPIWKNERYRDGGASWRENPQTP